VSSEDTDVSRVTTSVQPPFDPRVASPVAGLVALADLWRRLRQWVVDSYRPELHYMRGPGPKWREKHACR
jgi:hypothetical protein